MIEPVFNEFSAYPLCDNNVADDRFHKLALLVKHLEVYGIKKVRYENNLSEIRFTKDKSLADYCNEIIRNRNVQNAAKLNEVYLLYGRIKPPFFNEEEPFNPGNIVQATYSYERFDDKGKVERVESEAIGLLSAYLLKSFSIGFDNHTANPCMLKLKYCESKGTKMRLEREVPVICICSEDECSTDAGFIDLMSDQDDLVVKKATSKELNFTLPDHHGTKDCREHGKELLKTDYVKAILSSRSFDSSEKSYIHKVNADGSIEVRLYWTEAGYGLLVSTSAENIVQAHWVAKRLKKQYGK